jgi:dTDP-4-dehydro-6-deoxy-alpha-D-glucopyranose 2,3-dehydratase
MITHTEGFFFSSLCKNNIFQTMEEFRDWFEKKKTTGNFRVEQIPFSQFDQWFFTPNNERIEHISGKFYKIEGIRVSTDFGRVRSWDQPIINQPEIGILGILTKVFNGTRYFLMQVKMEPGNINILQLSPTVQATKSNFSKVHKGKLPAYLEYFIDRTRSRVLIDQLQTEQGARFLEKRNRNIIIEVEEDVEVLEDFCWLTLAEIKVLLSEDNIVNMDSRSVLSTIPLVDESIINQINSCNILNQNPIIINDYIFEGFRKDLLISTCSESHTHKSKDEIISWYTDQKVKYSVEIEKIALSELRNWKITEWEIFNSDRFFTVIGVKVHAESREVNAWTQPLIKDNHIGLLGFLSKKINGVLHFLVQAKVEPGNRDVVELSPTVACSNYIAVKSSGNRPEFFDFFMNDPNQFRIHYDTLQSEEGGRFFQFQNRNMIIEVNEEQQFNIPENFIWMTINQIMDLVRHSMFSIESRSLISSLSFR